MKSRALSILLLLTATPAFAGNSLSNPTFDSDLSGWVYVGTAVWDPGDALNLASSGSAVGTNNSTSPFTYTTLLISACLPVVPGTAYDGSFDYRIPPGQGVTSIPSLEIAWYSGAGCGGGDYLTSNSLIDGDAADGLWHRAEATFAATAPPTATFASFRVNLSKIEATGTATAAYDNLVFKRAGTCGTTPDRLCLNNDRFQVTASFEDYAGNGGAAKAQGMTGDTGYFWFFQPSNVEVVVKVINGCFLNSNYWIYAGGLTDVEVDLVVKDTRTGTLAPFHNDLGTPFQPVGNIGVLPVCP
jgi:hypothetical protein